MAAVTAFFIWGLFPLYWKLLGAVPAVQVLAHRGIWCAAAVWAVLLIRRDVAWLPRLSLRLWLLLAFGGLLITVNWGVYVFAVLNGHVIDSSFGYFITPLVNVLLAVLVLRERPTVMQRWAVAIATGGVALLGWELGQLPWISLALAASFGLYGLVRKLAAIDAVQGLAIESGLMAFAGAALPAVVRAHRPGIFPARRWACRPAAHAGWTDHRHSAGPVRLGRAPRLDAGHRRDAVHCARTVQLIIGVWFLHEPFDGPRQLAFGLIWVALALFTGEALWRYRRGVQA